MPFYKLHEHAKPGIYKPQLFDEAIRKRKQDQIADYVKQCIEEKLDEASGNVKVTIVDDMIIIRTEGYLSKIEKYIIQNQEDDVENIRSVRITAISGLIRERVLISFLEDTVNAEAIYCLFDLYPKDEYCIWLIMFDQKLA